MTVPSLQESLNPHSLLWLLENVFSQICVFFCLRPPTFKDKVKKCSPKEMQCVAFCHHHLPAFITTVPILCLEQYYFNVLLKKPLDVL